MVSKCQGDLKDLKERFGQCSTQLYSLQEAEKAAQKGDMSIEKIFTKMKSIWDELDIVHSLPGCTGSLKTTGAKTH